MSLEDIFSKLAVTTVSTVSRIALSHATNAAIRNVTTYISQQTSTESQVSNKELVSLQRQLDLKIKNLKPAVDMISHSVANGNQDLEPALEMCNDLKRDLDQFTQETNTALKNRSDPVRLVSKLKHLLTQVDDTVPSLYLSLRSIDSSSTKISSSKLVQASHILLQPGSSSSFTVTLYSLFAANIRPPSALTPSSFECTWKEEARKCRLTIEKQPSSFDYRLVLKEDTDDGLYHDAEEKPKEWYWQVDHIKRMFYTKSGKLLNIEDTTDSVLVVKLLKNKPNDDDDDDGSPVLTPTKVATPDIHRDELQLADWFAVGMWNNSNNSDGADDGNDNDSDDDDTKSTTGDDNENKKNKDDSSNIGSAPTNPSPSMNLLLLESVIKLALLEVTEQMNHLDASDELLNLYMS
ncbi:RanGTP-binding protein-domain-containing protein [Chlamydoabsidia padenii]|nr:RanGTP-binding protein-domain-containing protein [Chlamydoabsidia padenii]